MYYYVQTVGILGKLNGNMASLVMAWLALYTNAVMLPDRQHLSNSLVDSKRIYKQSNNQ